MAGVEKRWQIAAPITPEAEQNLNTLSPILRQILFNRGIATMEEAEEFLNAGDEFHDPFEMLGMRKAVERIETGIKNGEKIVVYGDYDADGVTASSLLVQALRGLGGDVSGYIPDRFGEGYGLNNEALLKLKEGGAKLIVTVDCGIRALPEAEYAKTIGLDLIITDHHTPGPELPNPLALINPKQPNDTYPEKNLAGAGVAYKLAEALIETMKPDDLHTDLLIDLVAIGTVADLVPLVGENRALVRRGLQQLRRPHRQGILSLMGVAGISANTMVASNIGFGLGPRINAAGRLDSAMDAFDLMLTNDVMEAGQMAQTLDNRNRERQKITREMQEQADAMVQQDDPEAYLLFADHADFNPGVVGLAASRLVDQYYRPSVVGHHGEEYTRASCRSIAEFNITHALEECADILEQYGGHAAAAGFTVHNDNLVELKERLKGLAKKQLEGQDLRPLIHADVEVRLTDLNHGLLADLDALQPTGYGNPEPVFVSRDVRVTNKRVVGKDATHLKLTVMQDGLYMDAIAFRQGHWAEDMPPTIDVIYNFEINEFNGQQKLQLNVRDIKAN